jgi:hypothetical protein
VNPEKNQAIGNVRQIAQMITGTGANPTSPNYAGHHFNDVLAEMQSILALALQVQRDPIEVLGVDTIQSFIPPLQAAHKALHDISAFDGRAQDAANNHSRFSRAVETAAGDLAKALGPPLVVAGFQGPNLLQPFQSQVQQLANEIASARTAVNENRTYIHAAAQEAQATLAHIRSASALVGTAAHSSTFDKEATGHKDAARVWLIATIAATLTCFSFLLYVLLQRPIPADATHATIVQYTLLRAVLVLFLSYVPFWCSRNYRSHRHLQVVNKHRSVALATFQTFVGSTEDPTTRNAVLLEATRCIFGPSQTGYLANEESNATDRVLEIVKSGADKG